MFTTGSKLLVGGAVLATVAAVAYGLTQGGALGTVGLSFAAAVLAVVAGVNVYVRDSDVSAMDPDAAAGAPTAAPPPGASVWPAAGALGVVLVAVGIVTYPVVVIFGLITLLGTTVEWMIQAWSERASADPAYNADVRARLAHPLEFPLLAAVGVGILVYSFSRIMLFISKAGGPAAFAAIAALILLGGFLIAFKPTLRTSAVAGVATVAALGLVAGGVVAAIDGEREMHHHETTADLAREGECGEEETEADDRASQTVAAKANITADVVLREDGTLVARAEGVGGDQASLVVGRNNPTNVRFRNETDEERRLVLELGSTGTLAEPAPEDEVTQRCTALVEEGGSQLLTFSIAIPSMARETPYRFVVPGVEGAEVEVVVP